MDATTYFLGNRAWWCVVLFAAPVIGAITGAASVAFLVGAALLLPSFVLFDTETAVGGPMKSGASRRTPPERVARRGSSRYGQVSLSSPGSPSRSLDRGPSSR